MEALRERLHTNALTEEDQKRLTLVKGIRGLRSKGLSLAACARQLGVTESMIHQFSRRGIYACLNDYLDALERGDSKSDVDTIVQKARQEFASFSGDAMDFYRFAFLRNPEEKQEEFGVFKDTSLAQWATEKVSKGLGLTEPEHTVRPVVNIHVGSIRMEMGRVARDDDAARTAAIDVTPEELPPPDETS